MDVVLCSKHQKPCYLKTGTKEGPSLGKNFYICSVSESRCQFVKQVELEPIKCPQHPGVMVELRAFFDNPKTQDKCLLLRCRAREEGKKWCTYQSLKKKDAEPPKMELSFKSLHESSKKTKNPPEASNQAKPNAEKLVNFNQWRESPINKARQAENHDKPVDQLKKNLFKEFSKYTKEPDKKSERPSSNETNLNAVSSSVKTKSDEKENANDSFSQWRGSSALVGSQQPEMGKVLYAEPDQSLKKALQNQLEKQKNLMRRTKISQLPDNGARLLENIKDLENYLTELELKDDVKSQQKEKNLDDSDLQIVASSFPPSKHDDDDSSDSDVQVVAHYPSTTKSAGPQVVKVFPPAVPGGRPTHMSTTTQKGPQVVKVLPPSAPGEKPIHIPTTKQKVVPPKSVQDWIDRNYKITKPHVPQNPQKNTWFQDCADQNEVQEKMPNYRQEGTFYGGRMTVKRLELVREAMKAVIDSLHKQLDTCPKESDMLPDPEGLKVTLMLHQKQALAWLTWRENLTPSGGILADDMGLGKTLTMISLILTQKQKVSVDSETGETSKWLGKLKHAIKSSTTLIITPASLIHQWNHEIKNRCKHQMLRVLIYHGPNREKDPCILSSYDVVLTTYKTISSELGRKEDAKCADLPPGELEKKELNLNDDNDEKEEEDADVSHLPVLLRLVWNRIILDEAHDIRNHKSLCATSVCRLRAKTRWAITGTPIQNKLLDMFSLMRFLRFSPFDEYKVWKKQVESNESLGKARLNIIIKSLMLRRTKTQTFEGKPLVNLSKKENTSKKLYLSKAERKLYAKIYEKTQSVVINYMKRHEDKEFPHGATSSHGAMSSHGAISSSVATSSASSQSAGNPFKMGSSQKPVGPQIVAPHSTQTGKDILLLLLRLRQCCCHPSLLKEKEFDEPGLDLGLEDQMKDLLLTENADPNEGDATVEKDILDPSTKSTKIAALMEEMEEIIKKEKAKCVVVSEWTKMLSLVARHVKEAGLRYHLLQGDVVPQKRMAMVQDFNENANGPEVMLLSLKAGGVGLNLIGGSHLFLMDSHWNPALEEQTSDRIHRVGQKKDVKIHRFICENTIEEKILALQEKKRSLARDILTGDGKQASKLGLNDLRMLFNV